MYMYEWIFTAEKSRWWQEECVRASTVVTIIHPGKQTLQGTKKQLTVISLFRLQMLSEIKGYDAKWQVVQTMVPHMAAPHHFGD